MSTKTRGRGRCYNIIMSDEARVLKKLRVGVGLSVREAAKLLGVSHGIVVHIETGRLDVPKGERLMKLLAIYGVDSYKAFYDRVRNLVETHTPRDELRELINLLSDDRVELALKLTKRIAEGKGLFVV